MAVTYQHYTWQTRTDVQIAVIHVFGPQMLVYFIVSLCVYVCDYVRASVSGLLRPFLSCGFYPLKSSFTQYSQAKQ